MCHGLAFSKSVSSTGEARLTPGQTGNNISPCRALYDRVRRIGNAERAMLTAVIDAEPINQYPG